jgi:REP element-mobilizing transposase RayT
VLNQVPDRRTASRKKGSSRRPASAAEQGRLPFRPQHGGARKGAGRKPNGERAGVGHRRRAVLAARFPVHVTCKLRKGLPRLRQKREHAALRAAMLAGNDRFGFRLAHYAILDDHLHLIVEAADRDSLRRGLQGLVIRIARALNKLWQRKGKVFADRYHDHILRSPKEVRNALRYVLENAKKHAAKGGVQVRTPIDVFSSAPWFDGFRQKILVRGLEAIERPVAAARTRLLRIGWRRHGLLSVDEPAAAGSTG